MQIVESTSSHRGAHVGGAHAVPFVEHDMFGCAVHAATSTTSVKERCIVVVILCARVRGAHTRPLTDCPPKRFASLQSQIPDSESSALTPLAQADPLATGVRTERLVKQST
jgi:hypothetical protein